GVRRGDGPRGVGRFLDLDGSPDLERISPDTPRPVVFLPLCTHPYDLGHHCPLELRAETALGTGRIPHAEDERRWTQLQEWRRIGEAHLVEGPAPVGLAEGDAVEVAVAEDRIGE